MMRLCFFCLALLTCLPLSSPSEATSPAPPAPEGGSSADAGEAEARAAPGGETTLAGEEDPPEGYYAFVESPNATPPRVRPPPYRQTGAECTEAHDPRPHVTAHNLCGDLNRGLIPRNPMGHSLNGEPYPFELIRNLTLRFLSRTLPVLRADDTLPRVKHIAHPSPSSAPASPAPAPASPAPAPEQHQLYHDFQDNNRIQRHRRDAGEGEGARQGEAGEGRALTSERGEPRDAKRFCESGGVFCMLYRAINGESGGAAPGGVERREDPGAPPAGHTPQAPAYQGPPTPCPARVEYATPVFARNYQGVWRYVVQIPYEGYFTQTVEVTRCMQSRCHYLDGGCLSSPRWVSLLVAELHYPSSSPSPSPAAPPAAQQAPHPNDFQEYQQYLQKRGGTAAGAGAESGGGGAGGDKPLHCDGHDELGCFQVRLYYDWFLVPGSCKCWRPDYFARYVRRRHGAGEL